MEPVHVLPDVTLVVLEYLRPLIAGRPEPVFDGLKVGRSAKPSDGPCIQVRPVAGTQYSPAHDQPQIDFLFWHEDAAKSMEAALVVRALTRAAAGDGTASGRITFSRELMRPCEVIDPVDDSTPQVMYRHEFFIR